MSVTVDLIRPLADAEANGFRLPVRAAPPPAHEPGWRPADAPAGNPTLLQALLDRTAAAIAGPRVVAATWHLEMHAWHAASTSLAAILLHGSMPPLEQALLHDAEEGWADAIALPASSWAPADGSALAIGLQAHLAPTVEALAGHRPSRALWRCAGDRLAQAALWCGEAFGDRRRAWALASEALAAPTPLAAPAAFELVDGVPFRRRTGCCLSHRCAGGLACDDCGLRSPRSSRSLARGNGSDTPTKEGR
jgi:hypothetical protein